MSILYAIHCVLEEALDNEDDSKDHEYAEELLKAIRSVIGKKTFELYEI